MYQLPSARYLHRCTLWFAFLCGIVLVGGARLQAQICIQQFDPERHHRFHDANGAASSRFLGKRWDWSGIGRFTNDVKWVTMLSPTVGVTAHHQRPLVGDDAYFFLGHGPDAERVGPFRVMYRTGDGGDPHGLGREIGGPWSDVALVQLDSSVVPYGVATYSILVLSNGAGELDPDRYFGRPLLIWGRHTSNGAYFTPTQRQQSVRLGRNRVNRVIEGYWAGFRRIQFNMDPAGSSSTIGRDECQLKWGDSGGPCFATASGFVEPLLVGTNVSTSYNGACGTEKQTLPYPHSSANALFYHVDAIRDAIETITGGQETLNVVVQ